jgi:hypothetical protein
MREHFFVWGKLLGCKRCPGQLEMYGLSNIEAQLGHPASMHQIRHQFQFIYFSSAAQINGQKSTPFNKQ